MILHTTRFGEVDFPEDQIIYFPEGILGFELETKFVLLPFDDKECPLEWMQSVRTPELAFVVTDPNHFIPEYAINLLDNEFDDISLQPGEAFAIRVIVTVPEKYINMTANLVGPIAFNSKRMTAKQFVLTTSQYHTKHYLFPEETRNSVLVS
tara:strand:- start:486 stop:941 length:456 start_codon:yes stop_codon:yes gene_type:complete